MPSNSAKHSNIGKIMYTVNLEFPLSRMNEALCILGTLVHPVGLHLYGTTDAMGENDSGIQVKAIAKSSARPDQWTAFCLMFNQDCVAISYNGVNGITIGPNADKWPFNIDYFKTTV